MQYFLFLFSNSGLDPGGDEKKVKLVLTLLQGRHVYSPITASDVF
jgi:hypothetical protein